MQQLKLQAKPRATGKDGAKALPVENVRGVVYGPDTEPIPVLVDYQELTKLYDNAGTNRVVVLEVEGQDPQDVLFKEIQRDPVSNQIQHFDMYAFKKGQKLQASVPITLVDDSPAVIRGATLSQIIEAVDVECIPSKIPDHFELSIAKLEEVGDSLSIADIVVDSDVTILGDAEQTVAKVEEVRELEVEDTDAPAEGEEGEAGEGEGEEGGGDSDASGDESGDPES